MSDLEKIPYFKVNKLFWTWTPCVGANGCLIAEEARLSMDKAPPPLRDQPPIEKAKPVAKREKRDPFDSTLDDLVKIGRAISRFRTWLDTPDPPKQPRPAPVQPEKTIPPFDIQDIPGAMRKEFMPVSAKLMERWFSGEMNYSPTIDDQKVEINQDGRSYSETMIDRSTIKMDWLLKHSRAKEQYDNLINNSIYSPQAYEAIKNIISRYRRRIGDLSPWTECGNDIRELHKDFQFQRTFVESTFEQKASQAARRIRYGGVPDDLTGALGAFNFYVAIAKANFSPRRESATVSHIVVYVRDSYSFEGPSDTQSQYLGHWSKDGVIVVPTYAGANFCWPVLA